MSLEKKINDAWSKLQQEIATGKEQAVCSKSFLEAKKTLFHILNIPSTTYNLARLCDCLEKSNTIEEFLKGADRYLPISDLESEAALKKYLEMYKKIRGRVDASDIVAFYRSDFTPANEKAVEAWMNEENTFAKMTDTLGFKK